MIEKFHCTLFQSLEMPIDDMMQKGPRVTQKNFYRGAQLFAKNGR